MGLDWSISPMWSSTTTVRSGDASVEIEGFGRRVGATSTVAGAAIVNAIVAEAVEMLIARGEAAEVFMSSNLAEGDAANAELLARYKGRVKAL